MHAEVNALYSLPNIIRNLKLRQLRWAGHVAHVDDPAMHTEFYWGNLREKRPLGRLRHRWEDNIKMNLRVVDCDPGDCIDLAEDRDQWWTYVRSVMNLWVPEKPIS